MLHLLFNFSMAMAAAPTCGPTSAPLPAGVETDRKRARDRALSGVEKLTHTVTAKVRGEDTKIKYVRYPALRRPTRGTIVSLCGGPGFSCVAGGRSKDLPPDYDVVTLDYLGIGMNGYVTQPERMSIEAQGEAVAGLVRSLKDKRVLLYGHSFGTTVATVAGSELTKDGAPGNLKGLVIEGVVGAKGGSRYGDGYVEAAKTAWSKLGKKERANFKRNYANATKGLNPEQRYLLDSSLVDTLPLGTKPTLEMLHKFRPPPKSRARVWLAGAGGERPYNPEQYRAAGCQINERYAPVSKLFGGLVDLTVGFRKGAPTPCACPSVKRDWNPDNFQIRDVPIVYINGKQDPQTPYAWAKSHFDGQKNKKKMFFATDGGGHVETMGFGAISACSSQIYYALFEDKFKELEKRRDYIMNAGCVTAPFVDPSRTTR